VRYALLVGLVLWATAASAQVIITPTDAIAFDYAQGDLVTYQVSHFEASWDAKTYALLVVAQLLLPNTPTGYTSFKFVPPFTNGNHTVLVRACNVQGCGGSSSPFRIRLRRR
jgi:hypothetical protein